MTEGEKPDLSKIEPIGRPPDAESPDVTPPAGDEGAAERNEREADATTSPETEEQMEQLRRG